MSTSPRGKESLQNLTSAFLLLKELIRSMLEVEVDQRYTALQVLEHPWVTVSIALSEPGLHVSRVSPFSHERRSFSPLCATQDEGLCENDHQLSVAGKIKKHFNTGPKVSDTTAGVSVISVSLRLFTRLFT